MTKTTLDDRVNKTILKACEPGKTYWSTLTNGTWLDHVSYYHQTKNFNGPSETLAFGPSWF
jgi:hypothetical protein